ncbi:hypothetical protein [Rhizobium sp. CECT 9324]|uniref:hypothetical protein n=1 Tax=Rhizobium sp. CECT 9324 TaxID=2845820 RepID=UPI001E2912FA|nr:hypothetical protein [Rhizobium sp. CECT 9324]CAH0343719.1 hypothetical protein RHI9324_05456 [Rhizobium sp. CECT 9324]
MASLLAPSRITSLDAVNLMLRNIGEDPVSSLGSTAKPTAQKAVAMLAEESINVQSGGYNFCVERELTLPPNMDGEIVLPSNILSFQPVGRSQMMVVQEGEDGKLYDAESSTYQFPSAVSLMVVLGRPFDTLPQPVKWFITLSAAMRFANSENPGGAALRVTASDVEQAKVGFERFDRRLRKGGLRQHNPHFRRMRGNR